MASKSLNKVMLIGNVTRDPELRYTPQGNAVCTMGLATNRSWKTENGEMREEAEFHRLVSWNKLAELCSQLCTKGRKIYVEGRLQTRTFTGSDNAQHTITEIVIDDMILLDSKMAQAGAAPGSWGAPRQQQQPSTAPPATPTVSAPSDVPADDAGSQPAATPATKGKKSAQGGSASGGKAAAADEEAGEVKPASAQASGEVKPFDSTSTPLSASAQGKEDVDIDDIPF